MFLLPRRRRVYSKTLFTKIPDCISKWVSTKIATSINLSCMAHCHTHQQLNILSAIQLWYYIFIQVDRFFKNNQLLRYSSPLLFCQYTVKIYTIHESYTFYTLILPFFQDTNFLYDIFGAYEVAKYIEIFSKNVGLPKVSFQDKNYRL